MLCAWCLVLRGSYLLYAGRQPETQDLPNAYHASLNGRSQQLCRVGHAHLFHHVRPVCFNRFDADLEPLAHFFIFEA